MIARSVLRQLGGEPTQLNYITHQIAQGDLSVDIPASKSSDSLMHGIQAMRDSLATRVRHFDPIFRPRWDSGVMQINYLHALMRLFPSFCVVPICT